MIAENYWDVNKILRLILDIEPSRRQEFLEKADISPEVRSEVESLLAVENKIADFMSLSVKDFSKDFIEPEEKETLTGLKIGNYEIVGELGAGGMGAVYLARRADGKFEQKVALKMLRREFNVEKIRRFFKRESEIQARLEHPFIARLSDVGTTDDGVPFIVMEYVEGVSVDKFCEQKDLSLKDKLNIFNKICQAVAHAHRNLIIHRDLKPSNILINNSGEPKLLDFGISKLLDTDDRNEKTSLTALGAMTPEYASPEQIKGEQITTTTDVYSLGVILYKMLTGHLPFEGKTASELLQAVTEKTPVSPSSIVRYSLSDSENRQTTNDVESAKLLKGDLDNIILKSLSKEPSRRYQTVEQFSADIRRHLEGFPVLARPATFGYRAKKFFKRNKISAIAAALILASLVGGIAVALWQAREAQAQAFLATESQKKSEREKEKSEKISQFMFKIFGYANPAWYAEGYKYGGQARVLDALENLSGKIETEFPEQADIQAELHYRFAEVFGRVASHNTEPARKEEMLERMKFHSCRALEHRRQFYGEWHELVAKDLYFGQHCVGKTIAENAATLDKAINMMRGTNPDNLNLPYMLNDYANRLVKPEQIAVHEIYFQAVTPPTAENKYEIAERYYREALPVFRRHYLTNNPAIFSAECNLAYVLAIQNKQTDFEEHFRICRQSEAEMADSTLKRDSKTIEEIEKILVERSIQN